MNHLTRGIVELICAGLLCLVASHAQPAGPITLRPDEKQLFLDDHVVEELSGLSRVMHRPRKRGPVLKADVPADGKYIVAVSAPIWIEEEGLYKLFYEARYEEHRRHGYALAVSEDGVNWRKPHLGLVEHDGSKDNNLFPTPGGERLWHVVFDPDDPDPRRRYKGFVGASGRRPAVSPDGLRWSLVETPRLPSDDAGTLTYDREHRQFLGLLKFPGKYGRSYNLSTSKDFVTWSEPRYLFGTDDEDQKLAVETIRRRLADPGLAKPLQIDPDPAIGWRPPEGRKLRPTWRAECYNIGVFPYEGIYIGWLMIFYPTGQRLPEWRNTDGFHLIQLAMTRDLKNWRRLGNREPFIGPSRLDEGLVGNYDRLQLMVSNRPVDRGGELWFYYTGMKRRVPQHDRYTDGSPRSPETLSSTERADWLDDTHSAVCLAVLRRDGFVSLEADTNGGYLLTKPLKVSGSRLFLNLDAGRRGSARVEIVDQSGRAVTGFTSADAVPVVGDAIRLPVSWKQSEWADLSNRTVRLEIHLNQASLYSLWTE